MLKEYNEEIFREKIKPMFLSDEKKVAREQQEILDLLRGIVNFQGFMSEDDYYKNMDSLISRMLRRRVDYTIEAGFASISEDCMPEGMLGLDITFNAFLFVLYLKSKRDLMV